METVLINQNKHWTGNIYSGLINRQLLQSLLLHKNTREVQILLGIRRSGKSTMFKLFINELLKKKPGKSILYINFDDPNYFETWKNASLIYKIIEEAEKITSEKIQYLFLDEVQNIEGWEKFVKSAYDSSVFKKIFVTGSNSSLLEGNYAKMLSGRYITHFVYPLSFDEIKKSEKINNQLSLLQNKSKVLALAENVLQYGSFPEVFKQKKKQVKEDILNSYFETILLKDCIAARNIRDIRTFKEFSVYFISNLATTYSYNSIAKAIGSNDGTIKDYVTSLSEAFLIYEINQFSFKYKEQIKSHKKAYCIDNGLIHIVSERFSADKGQLFENMVFNELIKLGFDQIYYYNDNAECDFIIKQNKNLITLQVCFELNAQNIDRETRGLVKTMKQFDIPIGYIITMDKPQIKIKKNDVICFWEIEKIINKTT